MKRAAAAMMNSGVDFGFKERPAHLRGH